MRFRLPFRNQLAACTELRIPAGSGVYLGAPATPIPEPVTRSLTQIVASRPEVEEAHVPQCWAPSAMTETAQILVVVLDQACRDTSEAEDHIKKSVARLRLPGGRLDIWFIRPSHSMLGAIRNAGCRIK